MKQLRERQQEYLLGLQRRNRKDTFDYIQQAETRRDWQLCPGGIAAGEKAVVPQTRVVEVAGKESGVRVLVVHSEERELYERSMRELAMARVRKELEALTAQGLRTHPLAEYAERLDRERSMKLCCAIPQ